MISDVLVGAVFFVVVGALVRGAVRASRTTDHRVDQPVSDPVTLLGVVPPPRSEMAIDSVPMEPYAPPA